MINEFRFTKEQAKQALDKLISKFNLTKIKRIVDLDEPFEKLVEQASDGVVKKFRDTSLKIGIQDMIIIGGFLRNKINFIHSGDKGFLKTCEELKINTVPIPQRDVEKENEIKKLLKKK